MDKRILAIIGLTASFVTTTLGAGSPYIIWRDGAGTNITFYPSNINSAAIIARGPIAQTRISANSPGTIQLTTSAGPFNQNTNCIYIGTPDTSASGQALTATVVIGGVDGGGQGPGAFGLGSIAIGAGALAVDVGDISIGYQSGIDLFDGVCIGNSSGDGLHVIAVGNRQFTLHGTNTISIGHDWPAATANNTTYIGMTNTSSTILGGVSSLMVPWIGNFTNGVASYATNATFAISATGTTNTLPVNATAYVTDAGQVMTLKDSAGNTLYTSPALTATLSIHLQPGWRLTAASSLSGTVVRE